MACTVLGVPLSAILFIDEDSQWCKQFSGDIEPDFDVPRSDSACRATIARAYHVGPDDLAVIHENLAETEFAQLPAVAAEGGVRFTPVTRCSAPAGIRWEPSVSMTSHPPDQREGQENLRRTGGVGAA